VLGDLETVNVVNVQIVVDISQDEEGRPVGTVGAAGQPPSRSFSGNLELLALIESHYRVSTGTAGQGTGPSDKEQS
jgi:hypothetical protein